VGAYENDGENVSVGAAVVGSCDGGAVEGDAVGLGVGAKVGCVGSSVGV
jgi:hypothetical protein